MVICKICELNLALLSLLKHLEVDPTFSVSGENGIFAMKLPFDLVYFEKTVQATNKKAHPPMVMASGRAATMSALIRGSGPTH